MLGHDSGPPAPYGSPFRRSARLRASYSAPRRHVGAAIHQSRLPASAEHRPQEHCRSRRHHVEAASHQSRLPEAVEHCPNSRAAPDATTLGQQIAGRAWELLGTSLRSQLRSRSHSAAHSAGHLRNGDPHGTLGHVSGPPAPYGSPFRRSARLQSSYSAPRRHVGAAIHQSRLPEPAERCPNSRAAPDGTASEQQSTNHGSPNRQNAAPTAGPVPATPRWGSKFQVERAS